jgi:hypothetical protein
VDSALAAAVTGLLDLKGSTDCSANPNYPAASKGDFYLVSVAGKIGGASGTSVDVGDAYFALADNAGGTEASVGTSWAKLEHNGVYGAGATASSTTQVLTGTDTATLATPDAIASLWEQGVDVASAGTVSLGEGGYFNITGTTTITDIDFATDKAGRKAWVKFAGVLTLTHNASTLILPTGANVTTAAGDMALFVSEGSDVVRCLCYQRADGTALAGSSSYTDEQARDAIGAALVAGTNIAITVNDAGDTITIDATGGGGGTTDLSTEYTSTSPSAPGAGLTIFDRKRAGRHGLSARSPNAIWEMQRALANRQIMLLQPQSSTPSTFGMNGGYSGNNGTMSTTNAATQERRVELATSGSAGTNKVNGFSVKFFWTTGGFFYSLRFGMPATFNAGFQWFMGLTDALNLTGDPSAKSNIIGFGVDAADSNIQFMVNDASGTATKTDLGSNFPGKTTGCVYEMRLFCAPGGSTVYYSLERFDSAQFAEGSASSDLPTATTLLGEQFSIRNGAIASAATIAMMSFYAELG